MTDNTDTDPAVDWLESDSGKIACDITAKCFFVKPLGSFDTRLCADIIRTAYAETQAKADEREQRLVELVEYAYRDGYTEGGGATVRETDLWHRSPSKDKLDSLLHEKGE